MDIGVSAFVKRQTPESPYSHFEGTWDELVALVQAQPVYSAVRPGYRDGVVLVSVPPERFRSAVIPLHDDSVKLYARFAPRRPGEAPFLSVVAPFADKAPAVAVDIVLYRADVLAEGDEDERSTNNEWEIISINARTSQEPEPMTPMAMARNFLGLTGGTKAEYTAAEFAEAIVYWSTRVMRG